ncbi:MAG: hypothetical protein SF053_12830 [Bacteroidia bacterium]|nr:hypothetical protein [Bacteroidia bacterium]
MNKRLLFILTGVICIVFVPWFLSREVKGAFGNVQSKLAIKAAKADSTLNDKRNILVQIIETTAPRDSALANDVKQLVLSLDEAYYAVQGELERHKRFLSKTQILLQKDNSGNPDTQTYWMGVNPTANEGHGDGQAHELRKKINTFRHQIISGNQQIAEKLALNTYYKPELLDQLKEGRSWEAYTFEGSLMENVVGIEATKLEQAEIYQREMDFLAGIFR